MKKQIIIWGILALMLMTPVLAFAQDTCPDGEKDLRNCDPRAGDLGGYLVGIFNWLIYILAIASFGALMVGGYFYMFSFGKAAVKGKGMEYMTNAIIGLVVGVLSYLLLNTIDTSIWGNIQNGALVPSLTRLSNHQLKDDATDAQKKEASCLGTRKDIFTGETIVVPRFECADGVFDEQTDVPSSK